MCQSFPVMSTCVLHRWSFFEPKKQRGYLDSNWDRLQQSASCCGFCLHRERARTLLPGIRSCTIVFNVETLRASLETLISHGIFIFPREISSFSLGKMKIPWEISVPKLALKVFEGTICKKILEPSLREETPLARKPSSNRRLTFHCTNLSSVLSICCCTNAFNFVFINRLHLYILHCIIESLSCLLFLENLLGSLHYTCR
jgi:hypothetical protein